MVLDYVERVGARAAQGTAGAATPSPPTAAFLARDMPELEAYLHYRIIDVSSIKELSRRWYPRAYFAAPDQVRRPPGPGRHPRVDRRAALLPRGGVRAAARPGHRAGPRPGRAPRRRSRGRGREHLRVAGTMVRAAGARHPRMPGARRGGCSSAGRAPGCGPGGRGFKSRHSPQDLKQPPGPVPRGSNRAWRRVARSGGRSRRGACRVSRTRSRAFPRRPAGRRWPDGSRPATAASDRGRHWRWLAPRS